MTVIEFCVKKTQVGELCVFRSDGWIIGSTWIDHEDLFTMDNEIRYKEVKSDEWGTLINMTCTPKCERVGFCTEKDSCSHMPPKEEVMNERS